MCDKFVTTISQVPLVHSYHLIGCLMTSGIPDDDAHAEEMLKIREIGVQSFSDFMKERICSDDVKFHDGLPRAKVKLFKQCCQKVNLLKDGKMKTLEVNRNSISTLLTNFAGNIDALTKWTLDRSAKAEVTGELKPVAGIEGTQDTYK